MAYGNKRCWIVIMMLLFSALLVLCSCSAEQRETELDQSKKDLVQNENGSLNLPNLASRQLDGRRLKVVATTSIIGDVVTNVAGDRIELLTLMTAGQDPHNYDPGASQLTKVSEADVIFVNGWDLEEGLVDDLAIIAENTPVVAVGANIEPLFIKSDGEKKSEGENDKRGQVDPHTWLAVPNVVQWVENIVAILSDLDPDNATVFEQNAQSYRLELEEADAYVREQTERIPVEKRVLVTNHDAFNYFAQEYGFRIAGTVIPASSTLAEPSARDLADLIKVMEAASVCTIFSENTTGDDLAQTVAVELEGCDEVKVLPLYSGSIGAAGSGVPSYTGLIRANVDTIVEGLE